VFTLYVLACRPEAWAAGRDEDLFVRAEDLRTVLFGSIDAGRSVFVSGGAKQTLVGPLDRPGYVLMETTGYGLTPERFRGEANLSATRFSSQASVLAGYQHTGGVYLAALGGPEITQKQLTVANRVYRISEARLGFRGQVELWAHPSRDTLVTGTLVGSSSLGSLWARASAGYRIWAGAFLGPEVTVYVTHTYRETRWGAHLTGAALGILNLRVSAGWMTTDDAARGSPYVGLTGWIRM
jgi:hypothetical protein